MKWNFLARRLKNFFLMRIIVFSGVFIFHRWLFSLFFLVFSLLIGFFMSPTLLLFCQVLHFCVVVPRVLQIWESFFYTQAFFTLNSFPTFGTVRFYQGFPGGRQFYLEGRTALTQLRFESQNRSICFFESYNAQQKVLVDRNYLCVKALGTLFQPLPGLEPTIQSTV